jgi:hypothetical protein
MPNENKMPNRCPISVLLVEYVCFIVVRAEWEQKNQNQVRKSRNRQAKPGH